MRPRSQSIAWRTAAVVLAAAVWGCNGGRTPERIVLIVVDTLRRDHLSIYGADVRTPNMERLAGSGAVVRNSVSSFHQTTMSMGAIFTGRTPSLASGDPAETIAIIGPNWCGLARFASPDSDDGCVPAGMQTLGEMMRDRGYWTAAVVANRLLFAPAGFEQGFDEWVEVGTSRPGIPAKHITRMAQQRAGPHVNAAVRRLLRERPNDRFFLYVHYMDVHDWHQRQLEYAKAVERMDESIGNLVAALEDDDLLDGMVIVVVGDHGEILGGEEHLLPTMPTHIGNPSFEQVLGVPLVVVGGDVDEGGVPFRSEDLYHFFARLVGASVSTARDLEPGELFLTEAWYRTYRMGRWKSYWRRLDGDHRLVVSPPIRARRPTSARSTPRSRRRTGNAWRNSPNASPRREPSCGS
jgi:arylsulfatase A-like enzyme